MKIAARVPIILRRAEVFSGTERSGDSLWYDLSITDVGNMGIFMQKFLEKFKQKPLLFLLPSASVLLLLFLLFFHSQQDADQAFSKYTSELFRQEISGNSITLLNT